MTTKNLSFVGILVVSFNINSTEGGFLRSTTTGKAMDYKRLQGKKLGK